MTGRYVLGVRWLAARNGVEPLPARIELARRLDELHASSRSGRLSEDEYAAAIALRDRHVVAVSSLTVRVLASHGLDAILAVPGRPLSSADRPLFAPQRGGFAVFLSEEDLVALEALWPPSPTEHHFRLTSEGGHSLSARAETSPPTWLRLHAAAEELEESS